uniref:Protein lingerer n=1 Tax=Anopheles coluzzii TaxID=1518534 RepID=A0A8W7PXA7_ANOCL
MSTQTRSGGGGGGGGRNKSKAKHHENKENLAKEDGQNQSQQYPKGGSGPNNASGNDGSAATTGSVGGGRGGDHQKQKGSGGHKGTDNAAPKVVDVKEKQQREAGGGSGGGAAGGNNEKSGGSTGAASGAGAGGASATHTVVKAKQPTAEQIRIAQITDIKSGMDDPKIQEKIQSLMETTQRSEEEVCCALQECDSDLDRAVIFLLETLPVLNPPPPKDTELVQQYSTTVVSSTATAAVAAGGATGVASVVPQYSDLHAGTPNATTAAQHLRQALDMPPMNTSSSLSAEQSQYFSTLSSQNSNLQPTPSAVGFQQQPPAGVIPSSAVEMPGDNMNNIGYLDVQFGGLDFGADDSFDAVVSDKFNSTTGTAGSSPKPSNLPGAPGLASSQIMPGQGTTEALSSQNDGLANSYSRTNASGSVSTSVSAALDQLTKSDPYGQSASTNTALTGGYQNAPYSSTQANKTASYPPTGAPQGYNNMSYSNNQVTNAYPPSTNNYSSYNQGNVNAYQPPSSSVTNNVVPNNNTGNSVGGVSNQSNLPVNNNAVNSSSNNNAGGYLSSQYPVSQTSSAFPSQQNYQNSSQNVYGNTGLNSNTGVASSTVSNSSTNNSNNNVTSSSSLPISSVVSTTTKSSSTTSGTSVVTNLPMVNPYIQAPGLPFYQQAAVYSYEDLQLMQQRMPHVPGFYDINYQTPTSLGAAGVRDANLGSVAYSTMSDGRFTRTDNNSSPVSNVPSSLSQQTGSGGPMLNLPYAYFYGGNMMPASGFQYGTPVYPQQMPTNAATSGGQFQKPAYNTGGYGSATGYDTLGQSGQDYNKNAYQASIVGQQQSKGQTVANQQSGSGSGSDMAPSMYGKNHVAINKVNYDKQSFHSGTPPPYNIAGTQTAGTTSAQPYGQHLAYIPTMATHHNINMHQNMHQDSNSSGQRPQNNNQGKTASKQQGYSASTYWTGPN